MINYNGQALEINKPPMKQKPVSGLNQGKKLKIEIREKIKLNQMAFYNFKKNNLKKITKKKSTLTFNFSVLVFV